MSLFSLVSWVRSAEMSMKSPKARKTYCPMYREMIEPSLCMGCDFQDGNQCSLVALAGTTGKIPTTSLRLLKKLLLFRNRTFPRKGGHTWRKPPGPERWPEVNGEEEMIKLPTHNYPELSVEGDEFSHEPEESEMVGIEQREIEELLREISVNAQVGAEEVLWDTYESSIQAELEAPGLDVLNPADIPLPGDTEPGLADLPPSVTELPHVEPEEPWPMP